MATSEGAKPPAWKHPDELLRLHRLQQKKKQLAARLRQNNNKPEITQLDRTNLLEAKITQKRKNPFAKETDNSKKQKTVFEDDDSLLCLARTPPAKQDTAVCETPIRPPPAKLVLKPFDIDEFSRLLNHSSTTNAATDDEDVVEEQKLTKHLPMDWSIKSRVRFFCRSDLPATTLKTSQMASGLTSFVRCINGQNSYSGLDISPASRFSQATYYWQHPHVPWMTLYPRNSRENNGIVLGERERKALASEWSTSFEGLFQLLRARQCPYFYLCTDNFTVLFRAAGVGGRVEMHALMSPTTRGIRCALKQEGIEYIMPLKKDLLNKSTESSAPLESNSEGMTETEDKKCQAGTRSQEPGEPKDSVGNEDDDDEEGEDWLENLGVDEKEIRRIKTTSTRRQKSIEMSDDFSDNSLVLIEGIECQGFFSFILNAKSTISSSGRLAGVPPTLLAPVAFPMASMKHLFTRSSKVRMDGVDYHSIEVKGVILPSFLPYICDLLGESKDTFSATLATNNSTLAFTKATQRMLDEPNLFNDPEDDDEQNAEHVFGQENLSDCGLLASVVEGMCRTGPSAVSILERVVYDKHHGYACSS